MQFPECTRGATPRLPGRGRRGWGLRILDLQGERGWKSAHLDLKAGRAGACPQFLDFQVLEHNRVGAPQKACVPGKHAVPQASRTPTTPVSALGPAGRQCPGVQATRRQGFSGVGVIHAPALKSPLWVFKSLRVPARQSKPTSKRVCVTKPVPTPAPGWGAEPGAMGKGPWNNRALSAPSTPCHAPGTSISQALFRAGGWAASSITSLCPSPTVL